MVHIDLWNDWAVRTDPRNWMLCQKGSKLNKETNEREVTWTPRSFHASLKQALDHHGESCLRLSEANSMEGLMDAIGFIQMKLDGVLAGDGYRRMREVKGLSDALTWPVETQNDG